MSVTYESERGRRVKIWAYVVGGIAAISAVAMFFTQIVDSEGQLVERDGFQIISLYVETLLIYISAILAVIGYILSWRHKLTAGILLVLTGIIFIVIDFLPDSLITPSSVESRHAGPEASGGPAFVFGIPALIAGLLFFWYLWFNKRRNVSTADAE